MNTRSERWTQWLESARDGDVAAFDWLLEEARSPIWRRAMSKLQDATLADEVASRTFIKAWKARGKFDRTKANAATWLYTIADRLTIDLLEQRTGEQGRTVPGFETQGPNDDGETVRVEPEDDVESAPPDEADRPLLGALVRAAMDTLSETDRQVLELCYAEQLSYEEIAAKLEITVKAVGPRLTRARQRLLERLPPEALV